MCGCQAGTWDSVAGLHIERTEHTLNITEHPPQNRTLTITTIVVCAYIYLRLYTVYLFSFADAETKPVENKPTGVVCVCVCVCVFKRQSARKRIYSILNSCVARMMMVIIIQRHVT